MLPYNALSTSPQPSDYLSPDDEITSNLTAKELGGVGLSDPSEGLQVKTWTARYDGEKVTVEADDVAAVTLFEAEDVEEIDLAFDQNMRAQIAFTQDGLARFWWFDTVANDHVFTDYPGAKWLRVAMDDKRRMSFDTNDIILTYVRDGALYYRQQRDRYDTEYLLKENVGGMLRRFGMNNALRLQWEFIPQPSDVHINVPKDPDIEICPDPVFMVSADPSFKVEADPVLTVCPDPAIEIEADPVIVIPTEDDDPCGDNC